LKDFSGWLFIIDFDENPLVLRSPAKR